MSLSNFDLQASHRIISILEKSKLYSELMIRDFPDLFLIIDNSGKALKGNAQAEKSFKFTGKALLGVNLQELFKPETWINFSAKINSILSVTSSIDFELPIDHEVDKELIFYWTVSLIAISKVNGNKLYAVTGRDYTQMRKNERRLSEMFTSMPIGIVNIVEGCKVEAPYSAYCEVLLSTTDINGRNIFELIFDPCLSTMTAADREGVKNLQKFYRLPFQTYEFICATFPRKLALPIKIGNKAKNEIRHLGLRYEPIVHDGEVRRIMILIEDRTLIVKMEENEKKNKFLEDIEIQRVLQIKMADQELLPDLMSEVKHLMDNCRELFDSGSTDGFSSKLHGVKGNARIGGFKKLTDLAHTLEKDVSAKEIALPSMAAKFLEVEKEWSEIFRLYNALYLSNLKIGAKVDVSERWGTFKKKLEKQIEVTAATLGKLARLELHLTVSGSDYEGFSDLGEVCLHLINNALDHGIESPEDRIAGGKVEMGIIKVSIAEVTGGLQVTVSDDGRGIEPDGVRKAAIKKGIITDSTILSDEEAVELIFVPQFSTASVVTEVSGRGIGLDAVKLIITGRMGWIKVHRNVGGPGTQFTFFLGEKSAVPLKAAG